MEVSGSSALQPSETMAALAGVPVGSVVAGRLQVERVIGAGAMGIVLCARHLDLGDRRAVKVMHPSALGDPAAIERFLREARLLVRLRSPHIARVSDVGRLPTGLPFLVMELLEGTDLKAVLEARGPLGSEEAASYTLQICDALIEAHAAGIVHRDIKPANLFVTRGPRGEALLKLLDFGIAKQLGSGEDMTATSLIMGTPHYMAPEQMRATRDVDARADLWAVGVLLYRMLAGRVPWSGDPMQVASALAHKEPPPPLGRDDVPPGLLAVIAGCLEHERDKRVPSAHELRQRVAPFARAGLVPFATPSSAQAASSITGPFGTASSWAANEPSRVSSGRGGLIAGAATALLLLAASSYAVVRLTEPRVGAPPPSAASDVQSALPTGAATASTATASTARSEAPREVVASASGGVASASAAPSESAARSVPARLPARPPHDSFGDSRH